MLVRKPTSPPLPLREGPPLISVFFNSLYDPFGSPCRGQKRCSNRYAIRLADHQRSTPAAELRFFCAGINPPSLKDLLRASAPSGVLVVWASAPTPSLNRNHLSQTWVIRRRKAARYPSLNRGSSPGLAAWLSASKASRISQIFSNFWRSVDTVLRVWRVSR